MLRVIASVFGALWILSLLVILGACSYGVATLPSGWEIAKVVYFAFLAACGCGGVAMWLEEVS